jgi:hypothetical protein
MHSNNGVPIMVYVPGEVASIVEMASPPSDVGSDLSHLDCDYTEWLSMFTQIAGSLTAEEQAFVLGRALTAWLPST